jgi:hypothetical protein
MIVFHNGEQFRAETNALRSSFFVVCKRSGQSIYASGDNARKLQNAIYDGWNKFGIHADGDEVWQWIWLSCGFYRYAEAA